MKALRILIIITLACSIWAKPKDKHHRNMALKDDLVAYWNMEQNPFLFDVHDQSGNGNHLTGNNSPILVPGKLGQAIEFNGTSQWLSMESSAGISHQGEPFTVVMWFKPLGLRHQDSLATTTEWGASVVLSGANYYVSVAIEDEDFIITDVPLVVGEWYFLALGWYSDPNDGTFVWGSVNLSARVRELQSGLTPAPSGFTIAGTSAIGWNRVVIDDTAILRRRVLAEELRAIYNRGNGLPFEDWDIEEICASIECCQ